MNKAFPTFYLIILGFLLSAISISALAVVGQPSPEAAFQADEVLVKFKPGVTNMGRKSALTTAGCKELTRFKLVPGLTHAAITSGDSVEATLRKLRADSNVLYAEPNYAVSASVVPDDPLFPSLYGLDNTGQTGGTADADIDASEAWDLQTGNDTVVAVIDTGLDYNHEDIAGNVWSNPGEIPGNGIDDDGNGYVDDVMGWDFVNDDNDPLDDNGHGTHVSGTIAAVGNNGVGVAGVNWSARIMALKFLNANGAGFTADAISSIEYATMMGARISSNSWGGGVFSQALFDAIDAAGAAGQLFAAAAGNAGNNTDITPAYPASYNLDNIVSVAATDDDDLLAFFSNFGVITVDLGAAGVSVLSTTPGNTYSSFSGTSMATPHVAGVAALVLATDPTLTVDELKVVILSSVDPVAALAGITVSGGRLNAFNALNGLVRVDITPATATVALGTTQQFTATGGTAPYTWSVSDPAVGDINATTGLFTPLATGITTVSATDSTGLTGTSGDITVTEVVVSPNNAILGIDATLQFSVAGGTAPYTWSSIDPTVASIDAVSGLLTALAAGTATVTATDANGFSDTTGPIDVFDVSISPSTALLAVGDTLQFSAAGGTAPYTWSSGNLAVATINAATGLLTAVGPGATTVTATDAASISSGSSAIEVREVVVDPQTAGVIIGDTLQFTATGGVAPYTWSVSDATVASIDPATGLLTALGVGSVVVTATDADSIAGSSGPIILSDVNVSPSTALLAVGDTLQFSATGGALPYTWSSSNLAAATIDAATGLLTAVGPGITTVTATDAAGLPGSSGAIEVREIVVDPTTASVIIGDTLQFTATGGVAPYTWSVSDATVASIDPATGLLTALVAGSVVVTTTDADGIAGSSGSITVTPENRVIAITPFTATVRLFGTLQFTASGGIAPYTWSLSNPAVGSIDPNTGLFTARQVGTTTVLATDVDGFVGESGAITVLRRMR